MRKVAPAGDSGRMSHCLKYISPHLAIHGFTKPVDYKCKQPAGFVKESRRKKKN